MLQQLSVNNSVISKSQYSDTSTYLNSKQFQSDVFRQALELCNRLKTSGVHSSIAMKAAGFTYTDNDDTACCETCGLEVSEWTKEMIPFLVHAERSPTCSFVCSIQPNSQPSESTREKYQQKNLLIETDIIKQGRHRTFSHWPHRTSPSRANMIEAGFFQCNVNDRVICLYCNLICQQWTSADDPCEVHKTLSPQCSYVSCNLIQPEASIGNEISTDNVNGQLLSASNIDSFRNNEIAYTTAIHMAYCEIPKRLASFSTWSTEGSPSVDDFVRAGFFYTGAQTVVTCFYCNGSLRNWGPNDDPIVEHARWFPHCSYAKQLCGIELCRKIEESKRAARASAASNSSQLQAFDESTLSRLVAARLDLPISQNLLKQNFKLSIIKRCWEDQLRLKQDDFVSDSDLLLACTILQKQIEHIDGKKENIIVPSVQMKKIRERNQTGATAAGQTASSSLSCSTDSLNKTDLPPQAPINESTAPGTTGKTTTTIKTPTLPTDSSSSNPCVLCLTEEKRLACIPCGHLATCVPCGHSLRSCPLCRQTIKGFLRIYL